MKIQAYVLIGFICLTSALVPFCSTGSCQTPEKDQVQKQETQSGEQSPKSKALEEAKKNLEGSGLSSAEPDKPHPGRDAPLWEKGAGRDGPLLPTITRMAEGLFRIGKVMINKREGLVTMPGEVNMHEGLVEYLACTGRGKLHESVLKLDVEPYDLQIALLLVGLEPGTKPLRHQGESARPEGDRVEIWVTWSDKDNKFVKHRGEDLILDKATNKPMEQTSWIFCGSEVINGRFMAAVEHSIVAVYHDPYAIIDHPLESGGSDEVHFANTGVIPPKGTPINFVIKSLRQPQMMGPRPPMTPSPNVEDSAK